VFCLLFLLHPLTRLGGDRAVLLFAIAGSLVLAAGCVLI
jgi:hypothetical protein